MMSADLEAIQVGQDKAYRESVRTYATVMHLARWFAAHLATVIFGLYFLIEGGNPMFGGMMIGLAIVVLGYGIVSATRAGEVAEKHLVQDGEIGLDRAME
ncbi:hypothetical protein GCM10011321_06840 [Youhaiella tibetensis]|uniref:Uncharacterized protein n=1 Tax=Paradevosia tibetensis TaxID=1447062 RepID=A0A5B9DPP4_9HYPH|nr:hypothetical protein [Youhaiella tibetensis]AKR56083.1 hypothetical protein XM25_09790 [Devosia sp. H5989]QEE21133.1 hypothetical protein FNA67_13540 [Youhaiella tibetensis]GGF17716.1 hypothetical protein GCM10011321_06840 [Youhaiella tibetensis]